MPFDVLSNLVLRICEFCVGFSYDGSHFVVRVYKIGSSRRRCVGDSRNSKSQFYKPQSRTDGMENAKQELKVCTAGNFSELIVSPRMNRPKLGWSSFS